MPNIHYKRGYEFVKHHQEFQHLSVWDLQASINIYNNLDETNKDYIAGMVAGLQEILASRQVVAV